MLRQVRLATGWDMRLDLALICGVAFVLGGCSHSGAVGAGVHQSAPQALVCEARSPGVLVIWGEINPDAVVCAEVIRTVRPDRVELDSPGGEARTAMALGDALAAHPPHIIVTGQCNSSCANYLLPVASRITLERDARIALHGSIDAGFVARSRTRRGFHQETARLQDDFARRHGIAPGWLLVRTRADYRSGSMGRHVSGAPDPLGRDQPGAALVLVEERFMRSCLTGIRIDPFPATLVERARQDASIRNQLRDQGVLASGDMQCVHDAPS